jgi:hypothetical protein
MASAAVMGSPWKSDASAPRKAEKSEAGFSPWQPFVVPLLFPSLFSPVRH